MRHNTSISVSILLASAFALLTHTATAQQFRKPLASSRDHMVTNDARFNIGVTGGLDFTTWFHLQGRQASNYHIASYAPQMPDSLGYFGGLALEYMLTDNFSVGLNVVYARHSMKLHHVNDSVPVGYLQYGEVETVLDANYRCIEAFIPFTYYMTLASTKNIKPYVYLAPRVSYVLESLPNNMTVTELENGDVVHSEVVPFGTNTYRDLNVGATAGVGSLFKINTANYYFLLKFDISANMNALSTFTAADLENEFNHLRYSADAHATLTLMMPVKKRLKGACSNWGEYD